MSDDTDDKARGGEPEELGSILARTFAIDLGSHPCVECGAVRDNVPPGTTCDACRAPAERDRIRALLRDGFARFRDSTPLSYRSHLDGDPRWRSAWPAEMPLPSPGTWVYLHGPSGCGKTVLALALVRHMVKVKLAQAYASKSPESVASDVGTWRFASAPRMAAALAYAGFQEAPEYRDARRASLLVLDDLGLERGAGRNASAIGDLLHERADQLRPTIITTFLDLEQLNASYGGNVARRVTATGGVLFPMMPRSA